MTNIYLTWLQLKTKHIDEGKELRYCCLNWNWQIYILDGNDVYICYIPRPDLFGSMIIDNQAQAQADFDDFNDNHKASAEETQGVKD